MTEKQYVSICHYYVYTSGTSYCKGRRLYCSLDIISGIICLILYVAGVQMILQIWSKWELPLCQKICLHTLFRLY